MPVYLATPPPPYSLGPGEGLLGNCWNAEQPVAGNGGVSASSQFALVRVPGENGTSFSVDGFFAAAPGAFEIDVQAATNDVDTQYQTVAGGQITSVDSVNNTFHFVGNAENARFIRLLMRSRANAVNVTATAKR